MDKAIICTENYEASVRKEKLDRVNLAGRNVIVLTEETCEARFGILELEDGSRVMAAFTSREEAFRNGRFHAKYMNIDQFLELAFMDPSVDGAVLDVWGDSAFLSKGQIREILESGVPRRGVNRIQIEKMDITRAEVECIVNAANTSLLGGSGVDGAIHRAAGPGLLAECRTLGGCRTGEAKITAGYRLKADYVIHTVGPIYSGSENDAKLLQNCYWNSLELARRHEIHSIAFPSISAGVYGYPLRDAAEIALKTAADWMKVNSNYGMEILFACFTEEAVKIYHSIWGEMREYQSIRMTGHTNDGRLEKAIQFAMDCHKGCVRKGTDRPYILHPIETVQILASMDADTNLLMAGVLHDTLEDTDATLRELVDQFGTDVAALVNGHTEDKSKTWYQRKLCTLRELPEADRRLKMLIMADRTANLRDMYSDYQKIGDELWKRFRAPKEFQAWYCSKMIDGLEEMMDDPATAGVYWEMNTLFKDLFVTFSYEEDREILYQISDDGESWIMSRETLMWNPFDGTAPETARRIHRREAERIEDNWREMCLSNEKKLTIQPESS